MPSQPFTSRNPRRPVNQLPPDRKLIGRAQELQLLESSIRPQPYALHRATISSIIGKPGVGKSALAINFANSYRAKYPDAQLYRNLRENLPSAEALDPSHVLRYFLAALGSLPDEIPEGLLELRDEFEAVTDGQNIIIVLDNASSYEQVEPIIPRSPTCHVIVTSSERFPETGALPLILRPLSAPAAIELFEHMAPSLSVKSPQDTEKLGRVLATCGGLPLAIRVLAARLEEGHFTLDRILDDLDREKGKGLGALFGPARAEIETSFRFSYRSLGEDQKRLFRRLGAVPGESFGRDLVAALSETSADESDLVLERLAQLQLLELTSDREYFTMHSVLRRFAIEQLEAIEGESRVFVLKKILDYYLTRSSEASEAIHSKVNPVTIRGRDTPRREFDQVRSLGWLAAEQVNLAAAVRQACQDGYVEHAWRLCAKLAPFFEIRGQWETWRETHNATLLALDRSGQTSGRAHVLLGLGKRHRALQRWEKAIEFYRDAVVIFRQEGEHQQVGLTLHALGDVYRYMRNWDAASNCLWESHRILHKVGDRHGMATVKRSLGALHRLRGDFAGAEEHYRTAIQLLEDSGDERWLAATRLSLADIWLDRGYPDPSETLKECLRVFTRLDDQHWRALTLRSLAEALRLNRQFGEVMCHLSESQELLRAKGDLLWEAQVTHSIGLVHLDQGRPVQALECFNNALDAFTSDGDDLWRGRCSVSVGRALSAMSPDSPPSPDVLDAYSRAWTLLVEQGARNDLVMLHALIVGTGLPGADLFAPPEPSNDGQVAS